MILFCQLDVTGRSEPEPVADALVANLIRHVTAWQPAATRRAIYLGEEAARQHLTAAGFSLEAFSAGTLSASDLLVVGQTAPDAAGPTKPEIDAFLRQGGRVIALGLGQPQFDRLLPMEIGVTPREHIACTFEPAANSSPLAGLAAADVMNRDPRVLPLVSRGTESVGNGVLATTARGQVVLCQLAPWDFDPTKQSNLKRTFRRSSFLVSRLLTNAGAAAHTPLLERFHVPVTGNKNEKRWSTGLYLDQPEEWDDPYRFFRW